MWPKISSSMTTLNIDKLFGLTEFIGIKYMMPEPCFPYFLVAQLASGRTDIFKSWQAGRSFFQILSIGANQRCFLFTGWQARRYRSVGNLAESKTQITVPNNSYNFFISLFALYGVILCREHIFSSNQEAIGSFGIVGVGWHGKPT